jgi:Protein of unknown function (DUF4244)
MPQVGRSEGDPETDGGVPERGHQQPAVAVEVDGPQRVGLAARRTGAGRLHRAMSDAGMTTAEYAVGTVAACGFAGVLYKLLTSGTVVSLLTGIVKRALSMGV